MPTERGFDHHSNLKAWMGTELFFEWLHRFDCYIRNTDHRKELLLLDNAPCHGSIARLPELSHVSVLFLPKRTKSRLQPMNAGVIAALKRSYRSRLYGHTLNLMDCDDKYKLCQVDILCASNGCLIFGKKLVLLKYTTFGAPLIFRKSVIRILKKKRKRKTKYTTLSKKMIVYVSMKTECR